MFNWIITTCNLLKHSQGHTRKNKRRKRHISSVCCCHVNINQKTRQIHQENSARTNYLRQTQIIKKERPTILNYDSTKVQSSQTSQLSYETYEKPSHENLLRRWHIPESVRQLHENTTKRDTYAIQPRRNESRQRNWSASQEKRETPSKGKSKNLQRWRDVLRGYYNPRYS